MNNKITIRLQGGIGNNLFQIACACAYSLSYDKNMVLANEKFGTTHNSLDTYKSNILSKINFVDKLDTSRFIVYQEPNFSFDEIPNIKGNLKLKGYYQSERNFLDKEKEIRKLFEYPQEIQNSLIEKYADVLSANTCSIHVRRGDYLNIQHVHPIQNMSYYAKAIKKLPPDTIFLIFSDDILWCKENFPDAPEKFVFIEGQKDYEDLFLMSKCKNNIIANSSFSWWGAWLNKNPNKIVIAPSNWFQASVLYNTSDLYCENWLKI